MAISDNKRFLVHEDGSPFFYLADTPWEIAYRLNRDDIRTYFRHRAEQGYTVAHLMCLSDIGKLERANFEGHLPFTAKDPTQPNDAFFDYVEFIVDEAEKAGMRVGLLPCWGDHVGPLGWGSNPQVLNPKNAVVYGRYLGRRFADKPGLIWILGGDRAVETDEQLNTWRALATGLDEGDGGRHLISFHPTGTYDSYNQHIGPRNSSVYFQNEPWLDFNMIQTGHEVRDERSYETIEKDYNKTPAKPTMETEYCYENHPVRWEKASFRFDDYDQRKGAYWSIFAGGHGFTYGCGEVFSFYREPADLVLYDHYYPVLPWRHALNFLGARQMRYVKELMLSRPYLTRTPDQSLLWSSTGRAGEHLRATRDESGSYAFIYCVTGRPVTVDLSKLSGKKLVHWWFDPRTGASWKAGEIAREGKKQFTPPSSGYGHDWVLVLDDAAQNFPAPGSRYDSMTK